MICFDTALVIWGVQGAARSTQAHMVSRTKRYITYLLGKNEQIMIPSPVLHEYLIKFDAQGRAIQRELIEQSFFVPSFDIRAAELAAELEGDPELVRQIRQACSVDRGSLRVDAQIIAVAVVNGADRIITSDVAHFKRLARARIEVQEVPEIHEQGLLFGGRKIHLDLPEETDE